jgi:hypothetical protein
MYIVGKNGRRRNNETKKNLSENMEYKTKRINSYVFTVLITKALFFFLVS